MFEKIIIALILVLAAVPVFSGCTTADRIEDAVESRVDTVEDAVENALLGNPTATAPTSETVSMTDVAEQAPTVAATPVTNPAQESIDKVADILSDVLKEQASSLHVPASVVDSAVSSSFEQPVFITPEEAERIALAHAGLEAGQVFIDRTERDYDNGVWHYEVEFHVGFTEYEYDIDAETGKILSFDQDR